MKKIAILLLILASLAGFAYGQGYWGLISNPPFVILSEKAERLVNKLSSNSETLNTNSQQNTDLEINNSVTSTTTTDTIVNNKVTNSGNVVETKSQANGTISHQLVITPSQGGQTAFDLLAEHAQVEYEDYGSAGYFVTAINGTKNDSAHYWAFYVNDEYSNTGVSQTEVQRGDQVKFVYEEITDSPFQEK